MSPKQAPRSPSTERSPNQAPAETGMNSADAGKPEARDTCKPTMEMAADQIIPCLSSPIWQPASKRVLDAVCVTDVTACSGVTVTVRESSVVDGFFRSRLEQP